MMRDDDRPMNRARLAGVLALVVFVVTFGLAGLARAQDSQGVVGTRHGCVDAIILDEWTALTSASLEASTGSAALAGSLYWTELTVKSPSAVVYVCLAGASSCGSGTTNKLSVASGATLVLPMAGLGVQTISLYGVGSSSGGSSVQVCGFFRVHP